MLKTFAKSIGEYKKDSIATPLFVTLEVLMEVIIPLLMATLIDDGIDKGDMSVVWRVGIILIISALLSLLFGVLAGKFAATASVGFATNLRQKIFYNVQKFSFSNIDKFSTSSIVTRLTTDVANVQNAYHVIIRIAVRSPAMLIFSLIMAFKVNSRLSIIFLIMIPIIGFGLYVIILKVHPIFERVFKTYDKLNRVVQENLRGIRVVKTYVREDHEKEKFKKVSKSIFNDFSKAEKILAFNMPLMQFAIYSSIILISWFGARMIVSTTMTTGELVSLIAYATRILMSLMMLSMVFVMIIISRASANRIIEVIEETSDLQNNENGILEVSNGDIEFENVSFSYLNDSSNLCLKKINIKIKSGEMIGILGGTGSSKTTLVQLIPRLYDATKGTVKVGGIDVRDYDIKTIRDEVSMVLQKNILFSGTIKENLKWGKEDATDDEIIKACKLSKAHEFIMEFPDGYDTYIEQSGTNVSGGQKQRICIARAILKQPKILILDDSTSAVDTKTDAHIKRAFSNELPNTTKIIIAQRVSAIKEADKIIVMDDGEIKDIGTHEYLIENNEIYQEVYNSQKKGGVSNG